MAQIVFDIEANALELKDVTTIWCCSTFDLETKEHLAFGPDELSVGLDRICRAEVIIAHNEIWYDIPVITKLFAKPVGRPIDTLILSRLLNPDRQKPLGLTSKTGPHSIEAWGYRFGSRKLAHEEWDRYSPEMLERCKQDVLINVQVYKHLLKEMNA